MIGMSLALSVLVVMVSVFASAVVINFPDPGLEAAIRDAIGKASGDIHNTDLLGLTYLNTYDCNIVTLEGIQYCVDLTNLLLSDNRIVDITALSNLTNIWILDLHNNQISDIAPLVNNAGIGSGDYVEVQRNQLALIPGSADR